MNPFEGIVQAFVATLITVALVAFAIGASCGACAGRGGCANIKSKVHEWTAEEPKP